ncbi:MULTISPECIES: DUF3072 domain-containing protein [Agrococcus]|uniref:DUF3072 domain-containing protein n=1 Tax=Agrococcus pavilionensis RW1 TaxID=1330458 RepID=U1MRJ2_9MICO|nr:MULTISPECIES: DUF3072 domain-containing protein [Agrococcus]ERG64571.1 hypothetical protein L332_08940 [Agrococcus pavilionensis RW1]MBO1770863.1 DUF3072 domain-containing protein [Agrococcus sp. TF02-05]
MSDAMMPEQGATGEGRETIGATGDAQGGNLQKDPSDWVSGDDPMTEAQRSYLDTLARQAGEELPADLTKAEASEHIERLRDQQSGTGSA